jgi:hypothetical protein
MIAEKALSETSPTEQDEKAESNASTLPTEIGGTKVLVAFDPYSGRRADREQRQKEFQQSLKKVGIRIVTQYRYGNYLLLDCGAKKPDEVLTRVPHHAGAIVFRGGRFTRAIASYDKKKIPKNYAVLRWGSTANDVRRMQADIKKYSSMPGVVAESVNPADGKFVLGNPRILKLTPETDKTLLGIFILAEAQFDYAKVQAE